MATPQQQQQTEVRGEYSTAEVTHVLEAIRLEGQCYLKNHRLMLFTGTESGPIREWHDNVTRKNLETFTPIAEQMGIALPFPKPLEQRENEVKEKIQGANVQGVFTEGEALAEIETAAMHLAEFYTTSMTLATHNGPRDAFRRGFENVADNLPRVLQALKQTNQYYPPPIARNVQLVAEKGVQPGQQGGNQ